MFTRYCLILLAQSSVRIKWKNFIEIHVISYNLRFTANITALLHFDLCLPLISASRFCDTIFPSRPADTRMRAPSADHSDTGLRDDTGLDDTGLACADIGGPCTRGCSDTGTWPQSPEATRRHTLPRDDSLRGHMGESHSS